MQRIDAMVAMTCDLIRFESVDARRPEIHAAVDYVERFARSIPDLLIERIESNGIPSLTVGLRPSRNPALILNAHLDVVPGRPEQFEPVVRDGRIYGRGSQDMKGSAAVLLQLLHDLAARPERPDLAFQFVGDEEIGGLNGTRVLLEEHGWRCGFFLTAEPTDLEICYAHKGAMWVDVTLPGKPAHGSRPWESSNPIVALATGLAAIEQRYPTPDEPAWLTTIVPTKVIGGDAGNRSPADTLLTFDIRYVPDEPPERILEALQQSFPTASIETRAPAVPLDTDPQHPAVQRLASCIREVTSTPAGMYREHFCTDARFYSSAGIPAVCLGPRGAGLHSDHEWVLIDSLEETYQALLRFADQL